MHSSGGCRPCHYYYTKTDCQNGAGCSFCHLAHPKRFRPRPCKSKRNKCKRIADSAMHASSSSVLQNDADGLVDVFEMLSHQRGYMSTIIKGKMRSLNAAGESEGVNDL